MKKLAEYLWRHWKVDLEAAGISRGQLERAIQAREIEVMEWAKDARTWPSLCSLLEADLRRVAA